MRKLTDKYSDQVTSPFSDLFNLVKLCSNSVYVKLLKECELEGSYIDIITEGKSCK